MQIDLSALPDDAATLQLMLRAVVLQQGELAAENDKLRLLIQRLTRHQCKPSVSTAAAIDLFADGFRLA